MRIRGQLVGGGLLLALAWGVSTPAHADSREQALRVLNSLPVSQERGDGYDRDLFRHWSDLDGNGCDTREDVLATERAAGVVRDCRVVGGTWISRYDGRTTTEARTFDIDHMVPLKEAWDSGAWRWDARTRETFANDVGYSGSLIAVTAGSNRSKSDRDPTEWLPDRDVCWYAKTWVAVKYRWRLAVDSTEKSALTRILRGCPPLMTVPDIVGTR
ncbi:MAG: HNH endonuclease [Actinobacteria bacterium]|nr:HNH endonuclease [Actinomycetota bacterium]